VKPREAVQCAEATFSKLKQADGWWTFDILDPRTAGNATMSASKKRADIARRRRIEVVRLALVLLGWNDRDARGYAESCNAGAPLGVTIRQARELAKAERNN
jgi:hypothetical protein